MVSLVAVQARSFTGNRLLVVLEEQAEREQYSVFLDDLSGKSTILLNTNGGDGCNCLYLEDDAHCDSPQFWNLRA